MNDQLKMLGLFLGLPLLLLGLVALFLSKGGRGVDVGEVNRTLVEEARNATGSAEAKVVVAEFSDFQCPACRAAVPVVKAIRDKFSDDVRLLFYHMPLTSTHKNSWLAAEAAEAAAAEGKFWQFHDVLYEKQDEWVELRDAKDKLVEIAEGLGVDGEAFKLALEEGRYKDLVTGDLNLGQRLGVRATPTFFVNGEKVDLPRLEEAVERALDK